MKSGQADLFAQVGDANLLVKPPNQLQLEDWPLRLDKLSEPWLDILNDFWKSPVGLSLDLKMRDQLAAGRVIYPRSPYRALSLTPFENVRVLILGQDPYHGPGQAEGLAFSVGLGQKIPPSLRNIFKEVQRDTGSVSPVGPAAGSLERWAQQGVLMLNTALTVENALPASHSDWGWEVLTDQIILALAQRSKPCAFLLWGAHAQTKVGLIDKAEENAKEKVKKTGLATKKHLVLKANHPSPLSAARPPVPFLGCGHFGQVNRWLKAAKQNPIDW
jgi:uracil-DNA glycosylase